MSLDLSYIYASDGTGDASLMRVTGTRLVGSTTLTVDVVTGVPTKFIASSGTLLPSGFIDPTTLTNFYGHLDTGHIVIDGFLPGSIDAGNTISQVVVIKPNTFWANLIADFLNTPIPTASIADGSITASKISTSALLLGRAARTGTFVTSSGTPVQVTGLSVTVTVPAGGRIVKVMAFADSMYASASSFMTMHIYDGDPSTGTRIASCTNQSTAANQQMVAFAQAYVTPAAGSKTYNVAFSTSAGTGTLNASSNQPAFIAVELV